MRLLALVACLVLCVAPSAARATCILERMELLWSYPADGEQDVPVNAVFWFLASATSVHPMSVWLDDEPLPIAEQREREVAGIDLRDVRVRPGVLRANKDYTLRIRYVHPFDSGMAASFEVHFRTGSRKAKAVAPGRVIGRTELPGGDARALPCGELFSVQGCFDAYDPLHPAKIQTFALTGAAPIAWFIETDQGEQSLLWPAQCGDPTLFVNVSRGDECFDLRAIGAGGLIAPRVRHCLSRKDEPTRASMNGFRDARPLRKLAPLATAQPAVQEAPPKPEPPPPVPPPPAPAAKPPAEGCALHATTPTWPLCVLALLLLRASCRAVRHPVHHRRRRSRSASRPKR